MYGPARGYLDRLLEEAGCEVTLLHGARDVTFGGHPPEPAEEYLGELIGTVREQGAHLGLATDGDADRFGVVDRDGTVLAPNPILALVLRHLLGHRRWRGGVARSVATTHLLDALAARHGSELHETPVGFKYLGDLITQGRAMFGGEESGGMSLRGHPPEKDGILACLLAAEVAAVEGAALGDVLERLYAEVGRLLSIRVNVPLSEGVRRALPGRMAAPPAALGSWAVRRVQTTDGLKLHLDGGAWVLVRRVRHRARGAALRGGAGRPDPRGAARRRAAPLLRMSPAGTARPARIRLDELLVAQGLASSRAEAARLILAGRVRLPGGVPAKAGRLVAPDTPIEQVAAAPFVGRGGEKLAAALETFDVDVRGRVCLDVGASTGGFTDCLLGRGALRVHAVDVGHGQLHPRLRDDARVVVLGGRERAASRSRPLPRSSEPRHGRRVLHLARQGSARRGHVPGRSGGDRRPREAPVRGRPGSGGQGRRGPGVGGAPGGGPGRRGAAVEMGLAHRRRGRVGAPRPQGEPRGLSPPRPGPRASAAARGRDLRGRSRRGRPGREPLGRRKDSR